MPAKYLGRVVRTDLEGGAWTFVTDQGLVFQLDGGGADLLKDGVRAEVEGRVATVTMGIAMVGEVLKVTRYRVLG